MSTIVPMPERVIDKPFLVVEFLATLKHARYIIGENPVTGFAFGLFVLIVFAAVLGPHVLPVEVGGPDVDGAAIHAGETALDRRRRVGRR